MADTEEWEGKKPAWTGILDSELARARQIQNESVGLKYREVEQAVMTTFLHSQPIGQSAKTRDLWCCSALPPGQDRIGEGSFPLGAGSYWLDDLFTVAAEDQLPGTWRLGNRPNLNQMHARRGEEHSGETSVPGCWMISARPSAFS